MTPDPLPILNQRVVTQVRQLGSIHHHGIAGGVYTDEGVPRGVFVDAMPLMLLDNGMQQDTEDDEVTLTAWLLREQQTPGSSGSETA